MFGDKCKGDGFSNTQCKRAKTEFSEDTSLFGFMREPPSLLRISSISVAIRLWTQPDVLQFLHDSSQELHFVTDSDYDTIEKGVKEKLTKMTLPNSLKMKIYNLIRPVGLQLDMCFYWSEAKYSYLYYLFKDRGLIYWTMQGTIDKCKSLKSLIDNQLNEHIDLFKLACEYCVEDCISDLWANMSQDLKSWYDTCDGNHLMTYWISSLRNQLSTFLRKIKPLDNEGIYDLNCSVHQNMVSLSIHIGNVNSLKYFWDKMTEEEKVDNIKEWLLIVVKKSVMEEYLCCMYGGGNDYINVLCFLLPHLRDRNELKEIFKSYSDGLLRSLFYSWPHNQFFLSILNLMMMLNCLQVDGYVEVMCCMIVNIKEHKIDRELFRKVWFSSSVIFQNGLFKYIKRMSSYVINHWDAIVLLEILPSSAEKKDIILELIRNIKKNNYSEILKAIYTFVPKTVSSDREINLLKMGILLDSKFVSKLIGYAGVQAAEQLIGLCFQALNNIQHFQKKEIDVGDIYRNLVIIENEEYVDQFLKWRYESVDEIIKFKISFLNRPLCEWFPALELFWDDAWRLEDIISGGKRWKVHEKLIHDSFSSPEEIAQFKKDHLNDVIGLVRCKDFEFALMFLSWFFISSDELEMGEANVERLYEAFVILGNFDYLEQFLKVYFGTKDEIIKFKKSNLKRPLNTWFFGWNLKYIIPECYERWKVYEKLINYNFCSSEEVAQFKEEQARNAVHFVEEKDSQLASLFLNWCFDSEETVHRYKIDCLMSVKFVDYLLSRICRLSRVIKIVKDLIRWFSPSPTEVENLKILLKIQSMSPNFKLQRGKALIYLFNSFTEECNTPGCSNDFGNDDVVKDILYGEISICNYTRMREGQ